VAFAGTSVRSRSNLPQKDRSPQKEPHVALYYLNLDCAEKPASSPDSGGALLATPRKSQATVGVLFLVGVASKDSSNCEGLFRSTTLLHSIGFPICRRLVQNPKGFLRGKEGVKTPPCYGLFAIAGYLAFGRLTNSIAQWPNPIVLLRAH
jgi:hypothetical protein